MDYKGSYNKETMVTSTPSVSPKNHLNTIINLPDVLPRN